MNTKQLELLPLDFRLTGMYLRKNVKFSASDGWQNKWTYKVGWSGGANNVRLVAMTDGMVVSLKSKKALHTWINSNNMVVMTKSEMLEFMFNQDQNYIGE